ncbi:hypothetical protein [Spirillospora sp. CA-294931]|uniref:hypothetical protein n=1 Tax=Spirillospora sp. CA-294931 TaxID=3240042 RepID=UPI003D92F2C7
MRTRTAATILALTAAAAVAGGATAVSAAQGGGHKAAAVKGAADFSLPFHPDQDIRHFEFDAKAAPYSRPFEGAPQGLPTDAKGTVKISHYVAGQKFTLRAEGTVDCLVTSPGNAVLSAKITRADEVVKDWVGKRLGFSVQDGAKGRDRVGLSWTVVNLDQDEKGKWGEAKAGTCMAPAAFAPVTKGGYTVRHAELPPPPKK